MPDSEWHSTVVECHLILNKCHSSSVECHSTNEASMFHAQKCKVNSESR